MNWQFIFSVLGITFLLWIAIALYIRRKYDSLQAKVFMLGFCLLALLITAGGIIKSSFFFAQFALLLFLSISVLLMIYGTWQWIWFLLVFRKAGRIEPSIPRTNDVVRWIIGLMLFVTFVNSFYSGRLRVESGLSLLAGCFSLIMAISSTQYRQNGILDKMRFIAWKDIDSISWETEHSKLTLHTKTSIEVIPLILHYQRRKSILEFIKLKLPTQFEKANISGSLITPTKPQTNQPTSLNS